MFNKNELINKKFGRLTVLQREVNGKFNSIRYLCQCECGNKGIVLASNLKSGHSKSCGCLRKENLHKIKHGATCGSRFGKRWVSEYRSWCGMKERCLNFKSQDYKDYGGRGIKVCNRWVNSFENFIKDMGEKPSPAHSLDRIDNNKSYYPENCKWSTPKEQCLNRRIKKIENFPTVDILNELLKRINEIKKNKWEKRYIFLAKLISAFSKDPSTKVGAVIVRPNKTLCSVGFNGFAKNFSDDKKFYNDREQKLSKIIHGEINALIHSAEPVNGYTLFTAPMPPCDRCCVQMLEAGISHFVWETPNENLIIKWGKCFERTKKYILETGASYTEITL